MGDATPYTMKPNVSIPQTALSSVAHITLFEGRRGYNKSMSNRKQPPEILALVPHTPVTGDGTIHVYQDLSQALERRIASGEIETAVKAAHPDATVFRVDGLIVAMTSGAVPHSEQE